MKDEEGMDQERFAVSPKLSSPNMKANSSFNVTVALLSRRDSFGTQPKEETTSDHNTAPPEQFFLPKLDEDAAEPLPITPILGHRGSSGTTKFT